MAVFLGGESRQEMPQQQRHVLALRPQRRHRDRQHMQAIEQVFAELPRLGALQQVVVGRRDDADIDLDRFAGADRLDLALLQGARSSLTCAWSGNSLTSSRKSVPPWASTNLPM